MTIQATICFILREDKILLLRKSEGLFGGGKWNAPGGKIKLGEKPETCAVREVREETGLSAENPELIGGVHFYKNGQRVTPEWTGQVFACREFNGSPVGGREGIVQWFNINNLPFDEMWEDDRIWYHLVFEGKKFDGWFYYSGNFEKLNDYKITVRQDEPLASARQAL